MCRRQEWTHRWWKRSAEFGRAESVELTLRRAQRSFPRRRLIAPEPVEGRFDKVSDTRLTAVTVQKSFDSLFTELTAKVAERDPRSSTVARVEAGVHDIGKKIVEEAAEVWMAAEYQSKDEAAAEISQLLYHIQVMMLALDLDLEDIYARL
jgi:phosphoribosyl-ATP pyrophosphohydrolase